MKSSPKIKAITQSVLTLFVFGCLIISQRAQAVSPAPDGGYPGGNTAEGQSALLSLSTGTYNTAIGFASLNALTTGAFNTAIGAGALLANTANENTATGAAALLNNTTGILNTANGALALLQNTIGSNNTAVGVSSLTANTTGDDNTATGVVALINNTTGSFNTATGYQALYHNTVANDNTADGMDALVNNTDGSDNTATGFQALLSNTGGNDNTAIGVLALSGNITGNSNTATGYASLLSNTIGINNTADGDGALFSDTSGGGNTATGVDALYGNTTGFSNTADGLGALQNSNGNDNVAIGHLAGNGITTASNVICIGAQLDGADVDNSCYIGNISGADATGGDQVFVTTAGKLGTVNNPSSARFKEEIKPMAKASEAILALRPVTFRYKKEFDAKRVPQFGLVAEEVEKINPDLVKRDHEGKLQSVRYDAVNAMLLNEFLKEHQKVERLEATVANLAAELRQVKAQVQTKDPVLRVAAKSP